MKQQDDNLREAAHAALLMLKEHEYRHPDITPLGKKTISDLERALSMEPMSVKEFLEHIEKIS